MATEQQTEEIDILQSIYPDELTILTPTSFRIKLVLDPPPTPNNSEEESAPPILILHVEFPASYPDVAPELDLSLDASTPGNAALSLPEDKQRLLSEVSQTIAESLGDAMVFQVASALKEAAENLITERATRVEQEKENMLRQEEEKEMEKFRGELVTEERFLVWRERWMREVEEAKRALEVKEEDEKGRKPGATPAQKEKKLTGKEMWERGLVGNVDEEEDAEAGDGGIDLEKLKLEGK